MTFQHPKPSYCSTKVLDIFWSKNSVFEPSIDLHTSSTRHMIQHVPTTCITHRPDLSSSFPSLPAMYCYLQTTKFNWQNANNANYKFWRKENAADNQTYQWGQPKVKHGNFMESKNCTTNQCCNFLPLVCLPSLSSVFIDCVESDMQMFKSKWDISTKSTRRNVVTELFNWLINKDNKCILKALVKRSIGFAKNQNKL